MKRKKRKTPSRLPISMAERHIRPIAAVILDQSSDTKAVEEAYRELLRMEDRYVFPPEYYSARMVAASTLNKSSGEILEVAEKGIEHYPKDVFLRFNLGAAYLQYGYPLLAHRELHLAKMCHTREDAAYLRMEQIEELIADVESDISDILSTVNLNWPVDREVAIAGEQVRRLMERGDMQGCVDLAVETLEDHPDQSYIRNNLARALWELGRIDDALSHQEESLRNDPDRLSGLANMVRFCAMTHRFGAARRWADHALSLDRPEGPDLFPLVEILAFMDEESELLTLAREREGAIGNLPIEARGAVSLLIGTACERAGRRKEARRWWKTAQSAGFEQEVQFQLDEADRPEGDRNDPWYFSTFALLPREIAAILGNTEIPEDSEDLASWVRPTVDAFPAATEFGQYLIRYGDDVGRLIGLSLLEITGDGAMAREAADLIRNEGAREERRAQAFRALESHGPVEMPNDGEPFSVHGYQISFEPTSLLPEAVEKLHAVAHDHLMNDEPDRAEPLLLKALDMHEDPSIRQNLAVAYQNQGKRAEALRLLKETRTKYPDYSFARLAEATELAGHGKAKEAHELIEPIIERKNLHVSEFTALCESMCSILVAEDKLDEAAGWLEIWRTVKPIDSRQERFVLLEGYRAMSKMMDKIGKKRKTGKS